MSSRPCTRPKGRKALFQDFASVLVLKGVRPSEELLVQEEKKYSLGTFSWGRRLHTMPYHTTPYHTKAFIIRHAYLSWRVVLTLKLQGITLLCASFDSILIKDYLLSNSYQSV